MTLKELLIDSSVLIDYLRGFTAKETDKLLESSLSSFSIITFIETCKYFYRTGQHKQWEIVKAKLSGFKIIPVDSTTGELAAKISALEEVPLADAIIYSTAITNNILLITSDKDLKDWKNVLYIKPIS